MTKGIFMKKTMKFEDTLSSLEENVEKMESGKMELEGSLGLFEEGIKLVRFCSSKLEEAKKKVEILVQKGGKMVPEPFESKDNDSR
jgi:exodeoxyribonuclease VII small subunit